MTEQGGEEQEGILGRLQNLKDNNSNNKSAPNEDLPQAETPRKLQKAKTAGELLKEKVYSEIEILYESCQKGE